jgi:hypothetical protein
VAVVEPRKAVLLLLVLQVLLNMVGALEVEAEKRHQATIVAVAVQFLVEAVVALADQLWLVFLNAVLAVELQPT